MPNPTTSARACGQSAPSHLCDPELYLGKADNVRAALNALEADYEYPGCGGYEMGVVVVSHAVGDIESFAKGVLDSWGIGKAACNNGIVLAMAILDRQMFIATGKGAREHVPDRELQQVIERMKPLMRSAQYGGAVEQSISDVARILGGESFVGWKFEDLIVPVFMLFVAGLVGYKFRQNHRYRRCKTVLQRVQTDHDGRRQPGYGSQSCPICLEDFGDSKKDEDTLSCGHLFHRRCIQAWEARSSTCPICRAGPEQAQRRLNSVSQPDSSEYHFRLRRVQHYYPEFVTDDMVHRWSKPGFHGLITADTGFIQRSPNYQAPNHGGRGSSSSHSSFGGGCSSGGGGAGGGW